MNLVSFFLLNIYPNFNYMLIILNLIGKVQVKNILMSVLAAYESNLSFKNIIKVIHRIKPVEGRLEKIGNIRNNSKVILDYAHTPEALKLALSNLKEQFPLAEIVNPDSEFNFVKPELIDSLTSNLEENWVFLETKKTNYGFTKRVSRKFTIKICKT